MIIQKVPHYVDSVLTQEVASAALQGGDVVVAWYTNQVNSQSVVHSHPYYELILPVAGSSVRYSVGGSVYDLHLGELILFPGEMYHSCKFNITADTSERLVVQIAPGIWDRAWQQSGLPRRAWNRDPIILDANAVLHWDFRGLLERMAQTVSLDERIRPIVQCCEVTELILLASHVITRRNAAPPPSATSLLIAKAVDYLQTHYTDPGLAAQFVERTGIDALAVAIGNAHGAYSSTPQINFEVLAAVRGAVSVPLVLHGASGIPDEDIRRAVEGGITKINIFTELTQQAAVELSACAADGYNIFSVSKAIRTGTRDRCLQKIRLFGTRR